MEQLLSQISSKYSVIFFIRQAFTILALFLYGYMICNLLVYDESHSQEEKTRDCSICRILLAFPAGMSALGICGLIILIIGIKYCAVSVVLAMYIFAAAAAIMSYVNPKRNADSEQLSGFIQNVRKQIMGFGIFQTAIIAMLVFAAIFVSVSGVISIGFSNDSMYYYSEYPRAIVGRGYLYYGFDAFLTDAGQSTVIINTLPYLFGFDEAFGIHTFFNINFIIFFAYAVYDEAKRHLEKKKSIAFSLLFTLLLITSMPFVLISKWNIANVYFMEQMFICLYLYFKASRGKINVKAVMPLLLVMLSFMRIEGALYAALILLCATMLKNSFTVYNDTLEKNDRKASKANRIDIVIPAAAVLIFQSAYFIKIFVFMEIYASETFMTKGKAAVIFIIYILIIIYACIFADNGKIGYNKQGISSLLKYCANGIMYIIILFAANIAVFCYDKQSYIESLKAIIMNLIGNSGWGIFPAVVIALIILMPKANPDTYYFDLFCICFVLMSIIACCLRGGGAMRISFADSGNRVFLQIVPFLLYAVVRHFTIGLSDIDTGRSSYVN